MIRRVAEMAPKAESSGASSISAHPNPNPYPILPFVKCSDSPYLSEQLEIFFTLDGVCIPKFNAFDGTLQVVTYPFEP